VLPLVAPGKLTYAKATATGANSFTLTEVVLTPPPNGAADEPVTIASVVVDDIDFEAIERQDVPQRLHVKLVGVATKGAAAAPPEIAAALGPGPYRANLEVDYQIIAGKELRLDTLNVEFPGLAKLSLALNVDGIESSGSMTDASFDNASLRSGALAYEDHSLLAKLVKALAKEQKKTEQQLVEEWSATLTGLASSQGNDEGPLLNAVLALLKDYQSPKGALTIAMAPARDAAGGRPLTDAMTEGVAKTLGVTA